MVRFFGPEHEALRKSIAEFTKREIDGHLANWARDGLVPRDLHRKAVRSALAAIM
jgi:acyl-CoA dehydrogenase